MKQSRKVQKSLQSCRHGGNSTDDVQTKRAKGSWYTHQCVCVCVVGAPAAQAITLSFSRIMSSTEKSAGLRKVPRPKSFSYESLRPSTRSYSARLGERIFWRSEEWHRRRRKNSGRLVLSLSIYLVLFLRACHSPGFQSKSLMAFWMSVKKCWSLIGKAFLPPKSKSAASK